MRITINEKKSITARCLSEGDMLIDEDGHFGSPMGEWEDWHQAVIANGKAARSRIRRRKGKLAMDEARYKKVVKAGVHAFVEKGNVQAVVDALLREFTPADFEQPEPDLRHMVVQAFCEGKGPKPLCRDCADHDGRCPYSGQLCDTFEAALEYLRQPHSKSETPRDPTLIERCVDLHAAASGDENAKMRAVFEILARECPTSATEIWLDKQIAEHDARQREAGE